MAIGVVAIGGVVVTIGAPRVARTYATEALAKRGIVADFASIHVGVRTITLSAVEATLEGTDAVHVHATSVDVEWSTRGAGDVRADGVAVTIAGEPDFVLDSVTAWRARHAPTSAESSGSGRTVAAHGLAIAWPSQKLGDLHAAFDTATMNRAAFSWAGGRAEARFAGVAVAATGFGGTFDRASKQLTAVQLDALDLASARKADTGIVPTTTASPALTATDGHVETCDAPDVRALPWPIAKRLKSQIERVAEHVAVGTDLNVARLTFTAGDRRLGPWSLRARLTTQAASVELLPLAADGRKPLELRATIPRSAGKWSADLQLGPATLAELGVPDGPFGLSDTATTKVQARGLVELDPDAETVLVDGALEVSGSSLTQPRLADGTLKGLDFKARGVLSTSGDLHAWTLKSGSIALGTVALELDGTFESTHDPKTHDEGTRVIGTWSLPTLQCGDALASMPKGLMPKLDGLAMTGTLEAHGAVSLDTLARDKAFVELAIDQRCKVIKVPASLDTSQFQKPFELRVYDPKGNPRVETFGPTTTTWTPFEKISPYVIDALLTCEDGAFFTHHGFSGFAIRNAMLANLKAGKFLLGASTISMQLAKNVFLDRRKVLSRKLQEAVLTAWLEQSLTKNEILELYLNVVEFGPNLYGIGPAAKHYFGRPASELDPLEALFLVSILPSPVRSHGMWEKGAASDAYVNYLRRLMREEHARGRLDDDEYVEAKDEPLVFHHEHDPDPAPRVTGGKLKVSPEGVDDPAFDPAWAPVSN